MHANMRRPGWQSLYWGALERRGESCSSKRFEIEPSQNRGISVNAEHHNKASPTPEVRRPDWRRIHHSPLFWIGVALFLAAIAIYVWSDDLSWRPRMRQQ
jgi:hypothetical protein